MLQVKVLEEAHELDLEESANSFLKTLDEAEVVDIRYAVSHFQSGEDQIFSFSLCILYRIEEKE